MAARDAASAVDGGSLASIEGLVALAAVPVPVPPETFEGSVALGLVSLDAPGLSGAFASEAVSWLVPSPQMFLFAASLWAPWVQHWETVRPLRESFQEPARRPRSKWQTRAALLRGAQRQKLWAWQTIRR